MAGPKDDRFSPLNDVPLFAAVDHRRFLDDSGQDKRLKALPRKDRRRLATEGRKIGLEYQRIMKRTHESGAGYSVDVLLRWFANEYTERYAVSGLFNQPISFNYVEPFCVIHIINRSTAPYIEPATEINHLFSVSNFFEFITFQGFSRPSLAELFREVPEGSCLHYTPTGSLKEFTFLSSSGREFIVAGFSLIKRANSLHFMLLGGEEFSAEGWAQLRDESPTLSTDDIPAHKAAFLKESVAEMGQSAGDPVALDGTEFALKTIVLGELDLTTEEYLGRCLMTERENSFTVACDDPASILHKDKGVRDKLIEQSRNQIEGSGVTWNVVEALLALPLYFQARVAVAKAVAVRKGRRLPARSPANKSGLGADFYNVSALEFVEKDAPDIVEFRAPHYPANTGGFWRRLQPSSTGAGPNGERVIGRTWVREENDWRARPGSSPIVFVKSSVKLARAEREKLVAQHASATKADFTEEDRLDEPEGVVYILRCSTMAAEVYKVGFTTGTASVRAQQLSAASGVPSAFSVERIWQHENPEALEANVHALLAPYRVSSSREFFSTELRTIVQLIDGEIDRLARRK